MDKEGRKFMTKRILIVDDAIFMRTMLKNILTKDTAYTYDIVEAKDGVEAITFIDEQEFDLVLMDITMPNMGGIEALKIIKEKELIAPFFFKSFKFFKVPKCISFKFDDNPFSQPYFLLIPYLYSASGII